MREIIGNLQMDQAKQFQNKGQLHNILFCTREQNQTRISRDQFQIKSTETQSVQTSPSMQSSVHPLKISQQVSSDKEPKTFKEQTASKNKRVIKRAQLVKRQIETKIINKVDNIQNLGKDDSNGLVQNEIYTSSNQIKNPIQQQQPLGSMRKQRLTRKSQEQIPCQEENNLSFMPVVVEKTKVKFKGARQISLQSQQFLINKDGTLTRPDDNTTEKKLCSEAKQLSGSVKSARMRQIKSKPHSIITSDDHQLEQTSSTNQMKNLKKNVIDRQSKRTSNFSHKIVQFEQHDNSSEHAQGQVSSARNNHLRDSFLFQDALIPSVLVPNGQDYKSTSSQQQLLTDLHSTKNIVPSQNTNNYRYHSEHISKVRQRPPPVIVDQVNCADSTNSLKNRSSNCNEVAVLESIIPQQTKHQSRLLFKRQDKNSGAVQNDNQSMMERVSSHRKLKVHDFVYHPSQEETETNYANKANSSSQISLYYPVGEQKKQLNLIDKNSSLRAKPQNQPGQKLFIGASKRETALRVSHPTLALPSHQKNQPSFLSNQIHTTTSQVLLQRERLYLSQQSIEELKMPAPSQAVNLKTTRSLRRTFDYESEQAANDRYASGGNPSAAIFQNKLVNQQRVSSQNKQQAITDEIMMNICEENSDRNPTSHQQKRKLTRQSIPVISTKHFLEGSHQASIEQEAQLEQQNLHVSSTSHRNNQLYKKPLSFDTRSLSKHDQDDGRGSTSHQHSNSVLPPHRHRHLMHSSVNVIPSANTNNELPLQLQHQSSNENMVETGEPLLQSQTSGQINNQCYITNNSTTTAPKHQITSARQLSHKQHTKHASVKDMNIINATNFEPGKEITPLNNSILVNKVQQKNQQFKFQFRRKSQQGQNFHMMANKHQNRYQTEAASNIGPQETTQIGGGSSSSYLINSQKPLPRNSHRPSASTKAYPTFHSHLQEQRITEQNYEKSSALNKHAPEESIYQHQSQRAEKPTRHSKLLSSESPPHSKTGILQHGQSQKHRALKKRDTAYQPSTNVSDGSDFTNMAKQVGVQSRKRLQSVAIQPISFSKRLLDQQEKVVTSSQNSGGNLQELDNFAPAQKLPNTSCEDETTTQKLGAKHRNTVYQNMHTRKLNDVEGGSSIEPQLTNRTEKRVQQYVVQMSQGASTSQDGGSSSGDAQKSLQSVTAGVSNKLKLSRNQQIVNTESQVFGQATKVTSYRENDPSRTGFDRQLDASECPYIIRTTTNIQATYNSNPVRASQNRYQNFEDTSMKQTTFDIATGQSFSVYRSNDDIVSNGGSATNINDSAGKAFAGGNSLHSAINVNRGKDQQIASLEPKGALSKTSSMSKFQVYQNNNSTDLQNSQKQIQAFKVEVYSDQRSAAEITRLQDQIKKRDYAYSNLKVQFEQLRQQVAKKHRNSSHESVPIQFETNEKVPRIESGQQSFFDQDEENDSIQALQTGSRTRFHNPAKKGKEVTRQSMNDQLLLMKQRSNSESHLRHLTVPIQKVQQDTIGHCIQEVKAVNRTPGSRKDSKLKQPTRFNKMHKDLSFNNMQGGKAIAKNQSQRASINSSVNPELGAPQVVELLKQKTAKYQKLASQSPIRRDKQFESRRVSLQHANSSLNNLRNNVQQPHNRQESKTSRFAESDGSAKARAVAKNSTERLMIGKAKASKFVQQGRAIASQKQKNVTQEHSSASLDRGNLNPNNSSRILQKQQINQIKKNQQQINAYAPFKQPSSTSANQKAKAKTTNHKIDSVVSMDVLGTLSQTNKLAIQNLKQAINSTSKKLLSKRRPINLASQSSNILRPIISVQNQIIERPVSLNEDLEVIQSEQDLTREEDGKQLAFEAKHSLNECQNDQKKDESNQFKCSAAQQDTLELEDIMDDRLIQLDSTYKEEIPSNEMTSQNSTKKFPQTNSLHSFPVKSDESQEFKATGTAFGLHQNPTEKSRQVAFRSALPAQEVNCFGIPANNTEPQSVVEQTSAVFPIHSELSQKSAAFPSQVMSKQESAISQKQASIGQQSSVISPYEQSRCDTPIHPNQIVDGIKFMDVQDPTYKSSVVFERCQDEDEDTENFIKQDRDTAPRQATPMLVMNSTGKEFFANKKTGKSGETLLSLSKPQVQAEAQPQQNANQSQTDEQTATMIQKSSIKILKQLQKKKQGMVGHNQRKSGHHPKVVISQNNPFFLKQGKQFGLPMNQSSSHISSNNFMMVTKASAEFQSSNMSKANVTPSIMVENQESNQSDPTQKASAAVSLALGKKESSSNQDVASKVQQNQAQDESIESKIQKSIIQEQHSVVSHEMFYSPIKGDNPGCPEDDDEKDKNDVEIMPQMTGRVRPPPEFDQGKGGVPSQFGARQPILIEESAFQVSQIDCVKRDDILDDSLLFALVENQPKNVSPIEIYGNEFNADNESQDQDFFAQQMALQPEIIKTPISSSRQSEFGYIEQSNMGDLIPTTETKKQIGKGLKSDYYAQEQHPTAAKESRSQAISGLREKQFDQKTLICDQNQNEKKEQVRDYQTNVFIEKEIQSPGFALTDQKCPQIAASTYKPDRIPPNQPITTSKTSGKGGAQLKQAMNNNHIHNSGTQMTITDMVNSNANLTYSLESSPGKGFADGTKSASKWSSINGARQGMVSGQVQMK